MERRGVPATTLRRLLDTPRVREKIGLGYKNKKLLLLASEPFVAKPKSTEGMTMQQRNGR